MSKENVCKVGVPVSFSLKYLDLIERDGYSYILYDYEKNTKQFISQYQYEGKLNTEEKSCKQCKECPNYKGCSYSNMNIYELLEQRKAEKVENSKRLYYLNLIDAELNTQRIMIRVMQKNKWIDEKKYKVSMELLYEKGKHESVKHILVGQ